MGIRGFLFCLVLCLALGRISGNVLETLEDLKEQTEFGKQNPRQGLEFLCWLLNQAKIDQNGNLRLNFNPAEERFGFHQYKNYEHTFPDLANTNLLYFSLGNLCYKNARNQLPVYFTEILRNSQSHPLRNIERIVIRIRKDDPTLLDEVYITQHFEDRNRGSGYNQNRTFKLSKQLLIKILELCRSDDDGKDRKPDQNDPDYKRFQKIQRIFPEASYQHWFLYLVGYKPDKNAKEHTTSNSPAKSNNLMLGLSPTPDGRARIEWDWIPKEMMEREMKICIYQNKDAVKPLFECPLKGKWCGETDTDLPFNADLEPRLEPIQTATEFFTFSYLLSLVLYPFTSLLSLVFYIFSSLYSLVFYIFSSLYSLVLYIFSSLYSLVLYIFSSLYSLVLYIFSSLYFLVLYIFSSLYSLVLYIFSSLYSLVISIVVIGVVMYALTLTESRAEPDFVRVSHGRPGL